MTAPFDPLRGLHPGPAGSATRALAVTPDDSNPLPMVARRLHIGTAGDLKVLLRDDVAPVLLKNVPVGTLQVWVRQVYATGTTATQIVALA